MPLTGRDGIAQLFPTSSRGGEFWSDTAWAKSRVLKKTGTDSGYELGSMRGSGTMSIANGMLTMQGSPRYYIHSKKTLWEDVEFTAYARNAGADEGVSYSGITLVARTNHHRYKEDPCSAHGYYCRLYFGTGQVAFQKEFCHTRQGSAIYSASKRGVAVNKKDFTDSFIGMKFIVRTQPDRKSVRLQLYLDRTDGANGGSWNLVHEMVDKDWQPVKTLETAFKCKYPYAPGPSFSSPVLGPKEVCFLRSDKITNLMWKKVSLRNI
ncbi:NADH:ubiquinone oxidoreductase intermediate-associated protein 30 domain-containing protein [Plasmodiophora brassicae]|uniref:Uncharacterized protein n=1 Tax=Plasmodiophora brassicae TaxID=37360 RepID=A0A0G4IUF6_PLABS|nr:hypothetical protein PBRA_007019 [Plasmodiophora brassicae]